MKSASALYKLPHAGTEVKYYDARSSKYHLSAEV